ncbi:MAG: hypothetical protein P4L83_05450 [Nevskia sp.]|nr:hypothetical protein [Nevskia sp.]
MNAAALLNEAYQRGARFSVHGGRLIVEAPAPLPDALMAELRRRKAEVMALVIPATEPALTLDPEAVREAYEERAAIMEYDAGLSRDNANRSAWGRTLANFDLPGDYRLH